MRGRLSTIFLKKTAQMPKKRLRARLQRAILKTKKEVARMDLPHDPYILLGFVNMKLRDAYPTLSALCEDLGADEEELRARLAAAGFTYDADKNAFI